MKQKFTKLLTLLLALMCAFALFSCEDNGIFGGNDKPGEETPGDEKPGDEKPGEEKPGDEKPGEETPGDEKPGDEKPGEEKPDENPKPETTPAVFYAAAIESLKSSENHKVTILNKLEAKQGDQKQGYTLSVLLETAGKKQHIVEVCDHPDYPEDVEHWFADDYLYTKKTDLNRKEIINEEEHFASYSFENKLQTSVYDIALLDIPAAWFVNSDFVKNDADEWCVKLTILESMYVAAFPEANISKIYAPNFDFDISYEISLGKDGNIKKILSSFSVIWNNVEHTITSSIEFSNIGGVTVTLPDGADTWDLYDNGRNDPPVEDPGNPDTPAESYAAFIENWSESTSSKMVVNNYQYMKNGAEESIRSILLSFIRENNRYHTRVEVDDNGSSNIQENWYVNGYLYCDNERSVDTLDNYLGTYGMDSFYRSQIIDIAMLSIPAAWFEGAELETDDDGVKFVKLVVTGEQYTAAFPAGMYAGLFQLENPDLYYEIKFNSDNSVKEIYVYGAGSRDGATMYIEISLSISEIGTAVVTLPEGAVDWPLADDGNTEEPGTPDLPENPGTSNPSYDYKWDNTEIKIEMTNNTASDELSSGCQRYYAGAAINAVDEIDIKIRERNINAAKAANVTVQYSYIPNTIEYAWGQNVNRIVMNAIVANSASPDAFCNFAYDMTLAQLRGAFANLKSQEYANGNFFRFNDEDYNPSIDNYFDSEAGEGYLYNYMESLALTDDKMYILASNYTTDVIRAMAVVPVNIKMLNSIDIGDSWTGRMIDYNDFYDLVWRDGVGYEEGFTYDVVAYYSQKVYRDTNRDGSDVFGDILGFAVGTNSSLASAALLYSSGVEIIDRSTLSYPESNPALDVFAERITNLFLNNASVGVVTISSKEASAYDQTATTDMQAIRNKFAKDELLFGGITMVGNLEDDVYQRMRTDGEGFGVLPVPLYRSADENGNPQEYVTYVHNLARVIGISSGSAKFSQCSLYLDYVSRMSSEILELYYEDNLGNLGGESITLTMQNSTMMTFIRNHATDGFQVTYDFAIADLYSSAAGNMSEVMSSGWHYTLGTVNKFIYPSFASDYARYRAQKHALLDEIVSYWMSMR